MSAELIPSRGWLSMTEAATYLGISSAPIREAVASGELEAFRKPRTSGAGAARGRTQSRVRISKDALDRWVRETWEPAS